MLVLQVDGTPGFPPRGVAGLGIVVRTLDGRILALRCIRAPAATNNEAEYQALIAGLTFVRQRYPTVHLRCLTDSQIVVEQLAGRSAVRAAPLQPLYTQALHLLQEFAAVEIVHIPRTLNRLADALAWEALGGRRRLFRHQVAP